MEKHFTVSGYIFRFLDGRWRIALLLHRKFRKWMVPGGHVECDENPFEAVTREILEELGVGFMPLPPDWHGRGGPLQAAHGRVPCPVALVEQLIPEQGNKPAHIHMDFAYFGLGDRDAFRLNHESHEARWFVADALERLDMFPDSRTAAMAVLGELGRRLPQGDVDVDVVQRSVEGNWSEAGGRGRPLFFMES